MLQPPFPQNEAERLQSLQCLRILDTQPEQRFDRVTRMAQRLFGVSICLISLVDAHRQWFKSRQGLEATETPRDISFCGHAILKNDVLVVSDASTDIRFADNPLVTDEPRIRFYAGCPIRGPNGFHIGTLCLIDPQAREFSDEDCAMLRDLACLAEDQLRVTAEATMDELTGLVNRRGFDMVAGQILSLCRRTHVSAELLFLDLDAFKAVNDTYGHGEGDAVLRSFAQLLQRCFRESDVVARFGGDEFIVLLTGSSLCVDSALKRLSKCAAQATHEHAGPVAWSTGRIQFAPDRHKTIEDMLAVADARMFDQKRTRRAAGG